MSAEARWSDEASGTEFRLQPRAESFLLLLDEEQPQRGTLRWSLSASELYRTSRWDLIEAEASVFVVCDSTHEDYSTFFDRNLAVWPVPADLVPYPHRLVGASAGTVRRHLLDGLVASKVLFHHFEDLEADAPSKFWPVRFDQVPAGFHQLLPRAMQAVLARLQAEPDQLATTPAACARREVVYYDRDVDVMSDDIWRVAYAVSAGCRAGWIVFEWEHGDTVDAAHESNVVAWFVTDKVETTILQKKPGLPMGLVVDTARLLAEPLQP